MSDSTRLKYLCIALAFPNTNREFIDGRQPSDEYGGRRTGHAQPASPLEELLIEWTTARFTNEPQESGYVRKSF